MAISVQGVVSHIQYLSHLNFGLLHTYICLHVAKLQFNNFCCYRVPVIEYYNNQSKNLTQISPLLRSWSLVFDFLRILSLLLMYTNLFHSLNLVKVSTFFSIVSRPLFLFNIVVVSFSSLCAQWFIINFLLWEYVYPFTTTIYSCYISFYRLQGFKVLILLFLPHSVKNLLCFILFLTFHSFLMYVFIPCYSHLDFRPENNISK